MKMGFTCNCCGKSYDLDVNPEGLKAWKEGALIQRALPELEPEWRELILSGTCPTCWDEMFGSEEDDI